MIRAFIHRRLMQDQSGLAYLEFALLLPLLMLLFLGGTEMTRYVQAAQKTDKMTHTVVDLIAQAPNISTNELDQIFMAVEHIMNPYPFSERGVMIISCVGFNDMGELVVKWQYKGGGALDRGSAIGALGTAPTLPENFVVEQRDNVIIAETYFTMNPMISTDYADPIEFYRTAYYLPRIGELDTLQQN